MNFTPSQLQAIQTLDQNLVVMAGAGSGKTSVLVQRYLYLLESHPDWSIPNIVAITFTEKAAKEMRARVRDAIDRLAETPGADQGKWRERQSQLDSARISTIHSLCAMLLRANAAEAGIDPAFTVLEEADAALLAEEAIEAAMRDLLKGDTAALYETWTPTDIRGILREHLETEIDSEYTAEQIYAAWEHLFHEHQAALIANVRGDESFLQALAWESPVHLENDKLYENYKAAQNYKEDVLYGTPEQLREALKIFAKFRPDWGSKDNWGGAAIKESASKIIQTLKGKAQQTLENWPAFGEIDQLAAQFTALWNAAIRHTQQVYREMKQDRAVLDFGDLERLARELLTGYPDVRARYRGQEFKHLLVDEFQDTNAAQREIVYALSGANSPGSLFVVGDPKQSIYGFRGAQLDVFYQVREEIITAGGAEVILSQSFRTHIPLIDLFNDLFYKLLDDYQDMQAEREWHNPEIIEVIALNPDKRSADDLRVWQADELAIRLKKFVEVETLVYDKKDGITRTAGYGDCAVLFQVIAHMNYVEDAFKRAGIPYVTHAGRGYYNRPEVRDLLNLLRALHNRADNLALASALRSPLFGMNDDTLYRLRQQSDDYPMLWEAIFAAEFEDTVLNFARWALPTLAEMAQRVPLPELIGAILSTTAYTAVLRGQPDGARMVNNIEKLIELARRNTQLSLGEFLLYLRDLTDRETREGEAAIETSGAVQLMTVHAAKGLEFPIVALYDCSYEHERSSRLIHTPEYGILCKVGDAAPFMYTRAAERIMQAERAEKLRKFYVAATRAQDYLILLGAVELTKTGVSKTWERSWMGQFYGAFGLPTDPAEIETRIGNGIRLYCPPAPPDRQTAPESADGWLLIGSQEFEPIEPPLLAPLPPPIIPAPQTLAATDLALLGEAFTRQEHGGLREFRNYILNNQTTILRGHSADRASSPPAKRTIGEIVHNTLQWLHTGVDVTQQIRASAWALGVTNDAIFLPALDEVSQLIRDIQTSPLWQEIASAEEIYREYPFSFKLGGRVINGKIDVLFRVGKRWHIVDFKSDSVRPEYIRRHAERYHMQLGVYAAAVTEALGKAPITRLHYLRPNVTITVEGHEWRGAVSSIMDRLALAMASED